MERIRARLDDKRTKQILTWVGRAVTVGIIVYLVYRLGQLGWREVLSALPRTPWFYLLFVAIYMAQPLAELLIYRQLWPLPAGSGMRALIKKRVFNEEMAGYSGEVYLFWWLRDKLSVSSREAFRAVRDINILSSVAAFTTAFALLGVLSATGILELERLFANVGRAQIVVGVVVFAVIVAILTVFRRYLFALPASTSTKILAIHYARLFVVNGLVLFQWKVGVPTIGFSIWLVYLCTKIVVDRIPFLPSKDLVFVSLSFGLAASLDHATTAIAGVMVAFSALFRITNISLFLASHYGDKRWQVEALNLEDSDSEHEPPADS